MTAIPGLRRSIPFISFITLILVVCIVNLFNQDNVNKIPNTVSNIHTSLTRIKYEIHNKEIELERLRSKLRRFESLNDYSWNFTLTLNNSYSNDSNSSLMTWSHQVIDLIDLYIQQHSIYAIRDDTSDQFCKRKFIFNKQYVSIMFYLTLIDNDAHCGLYRESDVVRNMELVINSIVFQVILFMVL